MNARLLLFAFISIFSLSLSAQSIGIIGSATPGGWDSDTDMVQDIDNPEKWTLDITLVAGEAKFRQDDDWAVNWGDTSFPTGVGLQGGQNIPIFAGDYSISFNSTTGEYSFELISDIGIIGDATPGGWDADTDMYQDTSNADLYFITLTLNGGEAKFRQDNDWAINWGSTDFPSGTALQDGDNIPVTAGEYYITFNRVTGEYSFEEIITFSSIGIIGDATPGGWDTDTDLTQSSEDANLWEITLELIDGGAKFRANDAWEVEWGGSDFPSGIGMAGSDNIPVTAGTYKISLNTETGEYNFLEVVDYTTVGIIGDATPGGWDTDTDMDQDPTNGSLWTLRVILTDGELKFRAEDDWAVNWGAGDFPTGVGIIDGANIPIPAGEYLISFNTVTGDYNFEEIVVYNTVGTIGTGSPTLGWDDDADMTKDENDEYLFVAVQTLVDGELKFRAEDDWAVNWGAADFPVGTGTQDGPNIPVTAGTYAISLVTDTGEYAFAFPDATKNVLTARAVKISPNPAFGTIRLDIEDERLTGEVEITILNLNGQIVANQLLNTFHSNTLDVSQLQTGSYILRIQNDTTLVGKKLKIIK